MGLCAITLRLLPQNHRPHPLDVLGALLLTGATITLLFAINSSNIESTGLLGTLSVLLWTLLAVWLLRARDPLVSLELLTHPLVRNGTLAGALSTGALLSLTVYLPLYMQVVLGMSAGASGVALIPLILGSTSGSMVSGQAMPRITRYRHIAEAGLILATVSLASLAWCVSRQAPRTWIESLLYVSGLGIGSVAPVCTISLQNAVPLTALGTVTAISNYARQLIGALMIAGLGSFVTHAGIGASIDHPDPVFRAALLPAFGYVCAGAALAVCVSLLFLLRMEERPLRASR
jgi:hypothetical protein